MLIKKSADIASSEITPKGVYFNRRKFLAGTALAGAAVAAGVGFREVSSPSITALANTKIDGLKKSSFSTNETVTPYKDVSNYNNYYEFSTDKYEPAGLAKDFKTRPWMVTIDGAVEKKQTLDVDTIIKIASPEERIYRHRCVEGWSIVVPWVGFSLGELINKAKPTSKAPPSKIRNRCRDSAAVCSIGLMSRACGWTKRCTHWRCCVSECMARRCLIRTALHCVS
jgi:sulfoxide reductase catalytic subunit YedY